MSIVFYRGPCARRRFASAYAWRAASASVAGAAGRRARHSAALMSCAIDKDAPQSGALPAKTKLMLLSPLGERLGEGVMQETAFGYPLT